MLIAISAHLLSVFVFDSLELVGKFMTRFGSLARHENKPLEHLTKVSSLRCISNQFDSVIHHFNCALE